jgi:hypothetical protein
VKKICHYPRRKGQRLCFDFLAIKRDMSFHINCYHK